ncbi:MAG TPA: sulfotransferase [Steroidobacteraceae bacterium]|nr:sulfotransferase [Steroidobacteraceae bacterium]
MESIDAEQAAAPVSEALADHAPIASEIARLRLLLGERKFPEALQACRSVLGRVPEQREALLFSAMAQRHLRQIPEAFATLATLERHHPRFSRLHEERGRCFVELRQAAPAIEAFIKAVSLNHALPGSWSMLEGLYRLTGKSGEAAMAASQVATLRKIPQDIVTATALFEDGDWDAAESLVRAWLIKNGDHIEAMRLLARIGIARKVYDDPEVLLAAVLDRAPDYHAARREYARVLVELHKYEEAHRQLLQLRAAEPDNRDPDNRALTMLEGACAAGLGAHERAIGLYHSLLSGTGDQPQDADVHLSIAHALKTVGRTQEGIDEYRRAAQCRPDFGDAYWSLANLKTYRFTDEELVRIRAGLDASSTATVDRYHLCFALAKALEDRSEFAESFHYYELGNRLKQPECTHRPWIIERNTQEQIAVCTPELFASRRGWGAQAPDPIFIVGLPRAGSTLIEQILSSHSQVEGTQELPNIQQLVSLLRGRRPEDWRYPRILTQLTAEDCLKLGEKYLTETRAYRTGKPFFIDKMPNNFRHLGLIQLILPNARIIDSRREPMACCFSNFKQLFANGQEFTYSIEDIARYYRTYLELMRHWDTVLPGRVLRVQHEDVIEDLEGTVRGLLDFCGLEFEPQCLSFHETKRSVRTASSEQVRQALYREGLDQWRNFEPWLQPLKDALGDALVRYRDSQSQPQRSVPLR